MINKESTRGEEERERHQPRQLGNEIVHRQWTKEQGNSVSEVAQDGHHKHARAEAFNGATLEVQVQLRGEIRAQRQQRTGAHLYNHHECDTTRT